MISRTWFYRIEILAAAVAIVGFLAIHNYRPVVGPLWNVMHGEIYLTSECPPSRIDANGALDFSDLPAAGAWWWDQCGYHVPYRFVLLWAVVIAAGGFAARRYS
jgi:hypothetical protein